MNTKYANVDEYLIELSHRVKEILANNIVGICLYGSLTYDDFVPGRSDIDLLVIVKESVAHEQFKKLQEMHQELERLFPAWTGRVECSYTPQAMFSSTVPPGDRPYWGEGEWYMATYGNEWIINNYLLQEHGIALYGSPFSSICPRLTIQDVQEACKRDLVKEWKPKLYDDKWLENPHYQSYLVLNLCRILHTIENAKASSKNVSAAWVIEKYPQWKELITIALAWKYGQEMNMNQQAKEFLQFVIKVTQNES